MAGPGLGRKYNRRGVVFPDDTGGRPCSRVSLNGAWASGMFPVMSFQGCKSMDKRFVFCRASTVLSCNGLST